MDKVYLVVSRSTDGNIINIFAAFENEEEAKGFMPASERIEVLVRPIMRTKQAKEPKDEKC